MEAIKLKSKTLLLSFFISTFSFGQLKVKDLKIDTTITGFHFAADFQGTNVFTKHGPTDIQTINPSAFSFTIATNVTSAMAKSQLNQLLQMSKQNDYKITDFTEKDTIIKGYNAYYISYTEKDEKNNYQNFVFNAFVIKDNTLILFTGGDLDNGQYINKFKETFYSIKL